ncbi:helix-turn-helix domain-containing protein [Mesorhizobium sp. VK25A]|uniref:Helix-turn-helix domain-containing protein n=1 Tax=Mesorhizobium vachelliae TaxID=3072309 RepID=A0ABU4ZZI6_9HYPH|nr:MULTISPECIES: helix-turn-helix domain-containing protein [unclassified Mesorhizobium]MDX8530824.1 helix-turn-helix domain-containing protein [Mesorhizobium sp. VK25D]MDX8543425.1 helix-turn-helix domain-containing protein [Mesorhizobium sp. VK25A]
MPIDCFDPVDSFRLDFKDPERFVTSIPGGKFGALSLARRTFKARVQSVHLGHDLAVRSLNIENGIVFRSELTGRNPPSTVYILPSVLGNAALLDGREISGRSIASRIEGHTPLLRTYGPHEVGTVTIIRESLRRAAAALIGRDYGALLLSPATTIEADPAPLSRLNALYREASELLTFFSPKELGGTALPGVEVLRDRIVTALVSSLVVSPLKPDHMARQLQTISMAKIDRFIEENLHSPFGLHELCENTGLALRTVEVIVRSRTGMSPVGYIRHRRLANVRRNLLNPDRHTAVTRVALDNGFLHLGRFSIQYRQVYGESPIVTLRRIRGY